MTLVIVTHGLEAKNRLDVEKLEIRGQSKRRLVRAKIETTVDGLSLRVRERLYLKVMKVQLES